MKSLWKNEMKAIWSFADCLTPEECSAVIAIGSSQDLALGTVGDRAYDKSQFAVHKKTRDSKVGWIKKTDTPDTHWLFNKINSSVCAMNDAWHGIRYFYNGCDAFQYTVYEPGQYYHGHIDTVLAPDSTPVRKVSCSILLSDPKEFEGGELVVSEGRLASEQLNQGQISVFPSIAYHQVTPVTKGIRISLVGWYLGPPWI